MAAKQSLANHAIAMVLPLVLGTVRPVPIVIKRSAMDAHAGLACVKYCIANSVFTIWRPTRMPAPVCWNGPRHYACW